MSSCKQRYVEVDRLLKAITILPEKIQDSSLAERHRADLQTLLTILQMQQSAIEAHQRSFPNQDRGYPIQLNDTQHRFLVGI